MKNQNTFFLLLALSVVLNAFLAGFVVSRLATPGPFGHFHGGPEGRLEHAAAVLDPASRAKVETIMQARLHHSHDHMALMHDLFSQVHPILTAPHFNEAQFKNVTRAMDAQDQELKDGMTALMVQIAKTLPDQQRIAFFEALIGDEPPFMGGPPPPGGF